MAEATSELQLRGLANLLLLQQRLREASTEAELGFLLTNDTQHLLPYRSAVLWLVNSRRRGSGWIASISGAVDHDLSSPYAQWMRSVCLELSGEQQPGLQEIGKADLPERLSPGWEQYGSRVLVWCPLHSASGVYLGGLALWREKPLLEAEQRVLLNWLGAAGYSLAALRGKAFAKGGFVWTHRRKRIALGLAGVVLMLMFLPVRLSVLAQAEIVPKTPVVVRSPLDAIVESIEVKPNTLVETGDLLVKLDDTELQTRLAVAQQALAISRAQYQQASQSASFDRDAKASLRVLALEIEKRESEVDYVNSLIARSAVVADRDGVVIMPDPDDLIGKPITTGERLLTIADPGAIQLEAWLTVGDDISLPRGATVEFFPNVSPDEKYSARLQTMDYRAAQTETGDLAFRMRGDFDDGQQPPRIGMRGTAKLYGEKVSLGFYLFRRPMATVRRWIGY
jgi:hypothetical protein